MLHLLCFISSGRGQRGVNVVGTLSQLLGDLTPVEFNNRNVVEDSTFYIRGNSPETPNVWVFSTFYPNVWKHLPPPQCLTRSGGCTPTLLSRRAGSDVDATAAADRMRKSTSLPALCDRSVGVQPPLLVKHWGGGGCFQTLG